MVNFRWCQLKLPRRITQVRKCRGQGNTHPHVGANVIFEWWCYLSRALAQFALVLACFVPFPPPPLSHLGKHSFHTNPVVLCWQVLEMGCGSVAMVTLFTLRWLVRTSIEKVFWLWIVQDALLVSRGNPLEERMILAFKYRFLLQYIGSSAWSCIHTESCSPAILERICLAKWNVFDMLSMYCFPNILF